MTQVPSPESSKNRQPKRSGVPHTVYFSDELTASLAATAHTRRVGKSTIIRIAVEELLRKLESGQLELPLGI